MQLSLNKPWYKNSEIFTGKWIPHSSFLHNEQLCANRSFRLNITHSTDVSAIYNGHFFPQQYSLLKTELIVHPLIWTATNEIGTEILNVY
uniref:Beta-galactosidase n=1 Tax=Heterorhabditis bacteriophora TaxID=37862 RepID=A0A1I7WAD2_HETBA